MQRVIRRAGGILGLVVAAVIAVAAVAAAAPAQASTVVARVDLSSQTMYVSVAGEATYAWPVSTARRGYVTPTGSYRPTRLHRRWYSRKYDNAPMPYSVFFRGGYAIHGTTAIRSLGRPASHGCIRLHPKNAATLFSLINTYGRANTRIVVTR
jgi:lipoprotein-anchoring transpeptidase ErfK/SrfK